MVEEGYKNVHLIIYIIFKTKSTKGIITIIVNSKLNLNNIQF